MSASQQDLLDAQASSHRNGSIRQPGHRQPVWPDRRTEAAGVRDRERLAAGAQQIRETDTVCTLLAAGRAEDRMNNPRIAQSGRAPALGAGGRRFESSCADHLRGCSSDGRAPALQAGCRGFEPRHFHQSWMGSPVTQLGRTVNPLPSTWPWEFESLAIHHHNRASGAPAARQVHILEVRGSIPRCATISRGLGRTVQAAAFQAVHPGSTPGVRSIRTSLPTATVGFCRRCKSPVFLFDPAGRPGKPALLPDSPRPSGRGIFSIIQYEQPHQPAQNVVCTDAHRARFGEH